jgi:drug/metabolite transporter (DMT)-like permease
MASTSGHDTQLGQAAPQPTAPDDMQPQAAAPSSAATKPERNPVVGFGSALLIVCIWSGWLIVSKIGAESVLTIFDITALRFGLSALISLPFVLYYRPWKGMPFYRIAVMSLLAGVPYVLISFAAFEFAPAAYGGVFNNGVLPLLTLALGWFLLKERPRRLQVAGAALVFAGAVIVAREAITTAPEGAWIGAVLFLTAALMLGVYMILNRIWQVNAPQVLLSLSVVSGLIYVPIWYLFLPTELSNAPVSQILLQGIYQLLPNLVGFNLLTLAVMNVGAPATSAVMSAVPSLGAILGVLILGEMLSPLTWAGIFVLSLGILLMALTSRRAT